MNKQTNLDTISKEDLMEAFDLIKNVINRIENFDESKTISHQDLKRKVANWT